MTLKTSSFKINKTIMKKTICRFWPIWALYLVIMIFMMPVSVYFNVRNQTGMSKMIPISVYEEALQSDKLAGLLTVLDTNLLPIMIAIFAIIAAVSVFSYLYSARSCNMMHAFPVKRTELFLTNYVSGFLFLLVPQVIVCLLTMAVCGIYGIPGIQYVALWLVLVIGMSFFFYSLAVFCCMLTGHFFAGFAFFFLFNLFYVVFANLLLSLASHICYGFDYGSNMLDIPGAVLSPLVYLSSVNRVQFDYTMPAQVITSVELTGGGAIGLYCIPAVILILLALFLYKRRHLECAAEMTAHRFVKPMTRWLVTIVAAFGLSMWFSFVFFSDSAFFIPILMIMLVICSWIIFFVLEMAINKKFKIFKKVRFLEWAICLAVMLLTIGLLEGDVFGLEKRVPTVTETKGIILQANHEMVVTDADEIAQLIEAHQEIVNSKHEYEAVQQMLDVEMGYVSFEYILADGSTFERTYNIPVTKEYMNDDTRAAAIIRSLQEDTDSYVKSWLVANYEALEICSGSFYKYNEMDAENQEILEKEDMEILYQAILKDIDENNTGRLIGDDLGEGYGYLNCHINFTAEMDEPPVTVYDQMEELRDSVDEPGGIYSSMEISATEPYYGYYEMTDTGRYVVEGYFAVYTTCEHTINALLELGLIEDVSEIMNEEAQMYYYD